MAAKDKPTRKSLATSVFELCFSSVKSGKSVPICPTYYFHIQLATHVLTQIYGYHKNHQAKRTFI